VKLFVSPAAEKVIDDRDFMVTTARKMSSKVVANKSGSSE
jgi:hypothetical protein